MVFHIFSLRVEIQVQRKQQNWIYHNDDLLEETKDRLIADYYARRGL